MHLLWICKILAKYKKLVFVGLFFFGILLSFACSLNVFNVDVADEISHEMLSSNTTIFFLKGLIIVYGGYNDL